MNQPTIEIIHGDCLEVMKTFESNSIDCVIADLPYEATDCEKIIKFIDL